MTSSNWKGPDFLKATLHPAPRSTLVTILAHPHHKMSAPRTLLRASRLASCRTFTTTRTRMAVPMNERCNDTAEAYRKFQIEKPDNPHMTNSNSTIANEMPSIGKDGAPPEMITSADPNFLPKDSKPENTERMMGGQQKGAPEQGVNAELDVGEIEGGTFRIQPIKRSGEDINTMRARLVCKLHAEL